MFAQTPTPPPAVEKLATTPVLSSELPPGFTRAAILRLGPIVRLHTVGGVRIDFSNRHTTESASFVLMKTHAAALGLVKTEAHFNTGRLFRVKAVAVGRFAVAVTATTRAAAGALLGLAVAHLRRSEG